MYGVILATALTTAAGPTQQWGGCIGQNYCQGRVSCGCSCGGCYGCGGGCYGCGCCGGCYGCSGYGCGGCACCGGCSGCSGCWGCQGGCSGYGCYGGCMGYGGGYGYGGGGYGYGGAWAMQNYGLGYANMVPPAAYAMYGNYPPYVAYSTVGSQMYMGCVGGVGGCYGCYGGWSGYGSPISIVPEARPAKKYAVPSEDLKPPTEEKKEEKKEEEKKENNKKPLGLEVSNKVVGTWATIVVDVPADAKVFIDGQQMKSKSARRVYQTPMLEEGATYFYDIRAEVVRDGKTCSESRRVILRSGQRIAASFDNIGNPPPALARGDEEETIPLAD